MSTNPNISMVSRANSKVTTNISLQEAMARIRDGTYEAPVTEYRTALATLGKEATRAKKAALAAFTFSGTFSQTGNDFILQHSGYICVDFDDLGAEAAAVRNLVGADPHCLFAFVSVGGNGVKALFRCDPTRPHLESWHAVTNYCLNTHELVNDPATKNVGRLCFVSHDPDAVFAAGEVEVISYPPVAAVTPISVTASDLLGAVPSDIPLSPADVRELLRFIKPRPPYDDWIKVVSAVRAALGETHVAIAALHEWSAEESPGQYADKLKHGLNKCGVGTLFYLAKLNGWVRSNAFKATIPLAAVAEAEKQAIEEKLASREFGVGPAPVAPTPRFTVQGKRICTPGNLTAICAQAKVGKSALVGAILAATQVVESGVIGETAPDCLSVKASEVGGRAVLHFDSEQSDYDHHRLVKNCFRRAKTDSESRLASFRSFRVAGMAPAEIKQLVWFAAKSAKAKHGVFAILIDGVADLVTDVNEAVECNALVADLMALAAFCDCPIICVVHENPSSGVQQNRKARGHLGSQLERKAETNLCLTKNGEWTIVHADKCRGPGISQKTGPRFGWNEEVELHMSGTSAGEAQQDQKTAELKLLAQECLSSGPLKYAALTSNIKGALGCASSTAGKRVTAMIEAGVIIMNSAGFWTLSPA